ncbi:MAG: hypothetical protein ACK41T_11505 [Pseudobdellovibrio sp.]
MMKLIYSFLTLLVISGCVTNAYYIENSNLPVSETRKAVTTVIGKPRVISLNGRELSSVYHDQKFEPLEDDKKVKSRYYTKVIILGPRRPYEISVQVNKEMFDAQTTTFVDVGLDENLSKRKAIEIKKALSKGLENYQNVDGENPF